MTSFKLASHYAVPYLLHEFAYAQQLECFDRPLGLILCVTCDIPTKIETIFEKTMQFRTSELQ